MGEHSVRGIQKRQETLELFLEQARPLSHYAGIFHKASPEAVLLGCGLGSGVILGRAPYPQTAVPNGSSSVCHSNTTLLF